MARVNGSPVVIDAVQLAREMCEAESWRRKPCLSICLMASKDLVNVLKNPPIDFEVRQVPGRTITVEFRRKH